MYLSRGVGCAQAADPTRFAVQYGETTRKRREVAWEKLAVKHLYALQLSRLYRPMRTFDPTRQPDDWSEHTTWVDLLDEGAGEGGLCDGCEGDEYEVERILRERMGADGQTREFLVRWLGYDERADTWEAEANIAKAPERLAEFEQRKAEGDDVDERSEEEVETDHEAAVEGWGRA